LFYLPGCLVDVRHCHVPTHGMPDLALHVALGIISVGEDGLEGANLQGATIRQQSS
jgi:hypothetical protein